MENNSNLLVQTENKRLFISGVPKNKSKTEIVTELHLQVSNFTNVIVYNSLRPKELNRGFIFVDFETSEIAARVRSVCKSKLRLFGKLVIINWSTPLPEIPPFIMAEVKRLFIRNIPMFIRKQKIYEILSKFVPLQYVEKVFKEGQYCFVHLSTRCIAEYVLIKLKEFFADLGLDVEVTWSKPKLDTYQMPRQNSFSQLTSGNLPTTANIRKKTPEERLNMALAAKPSMNSIMDSYHSFPLSSNEFPSNSNERGSSNVLKQQLRSSNTRSYFGDSQLSSLAQASDLNITLPNNGMPLSSTSREFLETSLPSASSNALDDYNNIIQQLDIFETGNLSNSCTAPFQSPSGTHYNIPSFHDFHTRRNARGYLWNDDDYPNSLVPSAYSTEVSPNNASAISQVSQVSSLAQASDLNITLPNNGMPLPSTSWEFLETSLPSASGNALDDYNNIIQQLDIFETGNLSNSSTAPFQSTSGTHYDTPSFHDFHTRRNARGYFWNDDDYLNSLVPSAYSTEVSPNNASASFSVSPVGDILTLDWALN